MTFLSVLLKILERLTAWAAAFLLIMSACLAFTDAIARTFFDTGFSFFPTLEVWGIIWANFLLAGILLRTEGHISVDFILEKLGATSRRFITVLNDLATLVFCLLATWAGVVYVVFLRDQHVTRELIKPIPYWIVCLITPIGMGVATLYAIGMLVVHINASRTGAAERQAPKTRG